ncbi:hypothetical protein EOD42_21605 [Rhodovarius crocodyli]|uniref:Uncharacterized protein n=1 Tax=Rhodovarius crocodyli TaxID=1979269 RepID=A0A437M1K9_9PROT|nr:hypothetical protein [Rhodovarius crocodyli]RVT91568.1 hypothetical protein EOD42_21605 [Rhodovarius crocodyli]
MLWSIVAFVVFACLGFLGMGVTSAVLMEAIRPFLTICFPPIGEWRGDWVWPILIAYGLIWPVSFLVAGFLDRIWKRQGRGKWFRRGVYLAVLYAGAVITAYALLPGQLPMRCL